MDVSGIPIVDFQKCGLAATGIRLDDCKRSGELIYEAFATIGFVYLENTGITREQIDRVNSITSEFYNLNPAIKQQYARDDTNYGYIGVDVESINPERPGDYKEAFNVTGNAIVGENTVWPDKYVPNFSSELKLFCEICGQLSERLLTVLSQGMQIKNPELFIECHSRMNKHDNFTTLRSLHYPPISCELKPGQIRLGEHSDYGSFTLLFQDNVGGLQVESHTGKYIDAIPIPDTVLVNIGDILQFWTEGRLKSTRHRVMLPESSQNIDRRSLAYFVHPNHEVILSGMEYGSHRKKTETKYEKPVTAFEHVTNKFKNSYIS